MKAVLLVCVSLLGVTPVQQVGGDCEVCDLMFEGMPGKLSTSMIIADPNEPGEPLEISGRIFLRDGKTPAANVILYIYHTDAKGIYSPAKDQIHARRHGHLRGWMKTNAEGRYRFRTIKPASYPDSRVEAHIHAIIKEPDKNAYYIDSYHFDNDPFLTEAERERLGNRGGSGIIAPSKNKDGVLQATRNIILGLNIPNYP